MKRLKLCILGLLMFTLMITPLLFACAEKTPVTTPPATTSQPTAAGPQSGGILKLIVTPVPVNNLGTPESHLGPNGYLRLCLETLLKFEKDGSFSPNLATAWEISPDKKSLTLSLKQGVKFHDGTDFNAEAAKYCLDIYKDKRSEFKRIESVDVIDSYTVRLNFKTPDSTIVNALAKRSFMFSPTAREKLGVDGNRNNPVGTGPFQFESFTPDVSYKVTRFKDYWQKGKPYLDGIEMIFVNDVMTANLSFIAGEADAIWLTTPIEMQDIVKKGGYNFNKAVVLAECLGGDGGNPSSPYSDVKVRQAVSYAIDTKAIIDAMGYGVFEATNQLAIPGNVSYNPNVAGYPYNPDKARQLLKEAGYASGFNTTIYSQPGAQLEQAFTAVQGYLGDVGIKVKLDILDMAAWQQSATGGWKDGLMLCPTQVGDCVDFIQQMNVSYSKTAMFFPSVKKSDALDARINEGFAEFDQQKKAAIMHDMQKIIIDDASMITIVYASYYACASQAKVKDLDLLDKLDSGWNPADVWISK